MGEAEPAPRQIFADRLDELLQLTTDPPLKNAVAQAGRRRPAGRRWPVCGRRVSDGKRGLPEGNCPPVRKSTDHLRGDPQDR